MKRLKRVLCKLAAFVSFHLLKGSPVNTAERFLVLKMLAVSSVRFGSLGPLKSGWR